MPTVQKPAAAVRQLTAVERPWYLTKAMPRVQQTAAAVRQLAAVEWP